MIESQVIALSAIIGALAGVIVYCLVCMFKARPAGSIAKTVSTLVAVAVCSLFIKIGNDAAVELATQGQAWAEFEARLAAQGCKVTGFTSQRTATYPVYTCPDGHAELGRVR